MKHPGFRLFVLDVHRVPIRAGSVMEWAHWFEDNERRTVAKTALPDGSEVSTVFIGCDHVLFETAHLMPGGVGILHRCKTWTDAEQAHAEAVAMLLGEWRQRETPR